MLWPDPCKFTNLAYFNQKDFKPRYLENILVLLSIVLLLCPKVYAAHHPFFATHSLTHKDSPQGYVMKTHKGVMRSKVDCCFFSLCLFHPIQQIFIFRRWFWYMYKLGKDNSQTLWSLMPCNINYVRCSRVG